MQGIYGIDSLRVFDRRQKEPLYIISPEFEWENKEPKMYEFAICNRMYILMYYKNKFYYTLDEINELNEILFKDKKEPVMATGWSYRKYQKEPVETTQETWNIQNKPTNENIKKRVPILLKTSFRSTDWTTSVRLSDFGFGKHLTAHDIFQKISDFLGYLIDHPEIPNKQTDKEKA